ncbi:bifunctional 3,4-dihydroxy-2-butanone-4-phosphate synthase/GTP cyclohydrolase II [Vreelandella utahensis]|uniref:bifunctional 3,4-dihydroxy-2-butanone-4-phosphate synthase/GTP cyclohydrolase II n=1 Tax=Vreelandella halophila TaxID=86177 RepID=UPI000986A6AF|nr:bifunctional 3,4-dihydroxy-2-butanone-4-phosphate synthase/GTP cyclohydrolase II [Halomonas utahensis]
MALNSIEEILQDIREGRMVILMDDEDRENEGDVIMAAECVQPEHVTFMATEARGLICMPMARERCERLNLPLMVQRNSSGFGTKFTVSVEAAKGVTTGISAADRARTVQVAAARGARAEDIVSPGHIFPLMAQPGGVLSRAGHTEAACDLASMAGFESAGVICEVMNDDGTMARRPQLEEFAERHGLKIGTIADLIHYRTMNERTVECVDHYEMKTEYGVFRLHTYRDSIQGETHLALTMGEVDPEKPTLVRVHITDTLRDLLHANYPGSPRWPLHEAMRKVAAEGSGVIVLLNNGQDSYALEERIRGFFEAHAQGLKAPDSTGSSGVYLTVGTGSQILRDLGVGRMRLMSAPIKFSGISGFDLEVVEYLPYDDGNDQQG